MYCHNCESNPCSCQREKLAHPATVTRSTYQPLHDGITKEEFGINLYETIKTIGGILGIDQQRASAIHKNQQKVGKDLSTRRHTLQRTLATQLPLLTDAEMNQILARYPWVVGA